MLYRINIETYLLQSFIIGYDVNGALFIGKHINDASNILVFLHCERERMLSTICCLLFYTWVYWSQSWASNYQATVLGYDRKKLTYCVYPGCFGKARNNDAGITLPQWRKCFLSSPSQLWLYKRHLCLASFCYLDSGRFVNHLPTILIDTKSYLDTTHYYNLIKCWWLSVGVNLLFRVFELGNIMFWKAKPKYLYLMI